MNVFLQNPFNIILPTVPRSPKQSFSFGFGDQNSLCMLYHPHASYMPYAPQFEPLHNILQKVQIMKLLIMGNLGKQ
jgi:hypothetical protein